MDLIKLTQNYPKVKLIEHEDVVCLEMFNIKYQDFLNIQAELTEIVRHDSKKKFYLFASHPLTLTMGRGDRQNQDQGNESLAPEGIPLHYIKRGGGLTFHTPNQWIFYPIMKLNSTSHTLSKHIEWLMDLVTNVSKNNFGIELLPKRNPLGVWYGLNKVGSVGVGVERFVTNHGLAFNVNKIEFSPEQFALMNPCGLTSNTYKSLSEIYQKEISVAEFHGHALKALNLS